MNAIYQHDSEPRMETIVSTPQSASPAPQSLLRYSFLPCPQPGAGVHRWAFYAANRAAELGLNDDQAVPLIEGMMTRDPQPNEVEDALSAARREAREPRPRVASWPDVDAEKVAQVTATGPTLLELWDQSPVRWNDPSPRTDAVLDVLFPGNPLLCLGADKSRFDTRLRERWHGWCTMKPFIVPSAMSKLRGRTKAGRSSAHSLDNTGPRQYLVAEFDAGDLDQHAAILHHLERFAPLVLAVFSGNKSLHGWFNVKGRPDETNEKFMRYAVSLGADPATWVRSQFVRVPDGRRIDGKCRSDALPSGFRDVATGLQAVAYFNPEAAE